MKFSIHRHLLITALAKLKGVIPSCSTLEILRTVLIEQVNPSRIRLTVTDLDQTVSLEVSATVTESAPSCVHLSRLFAVLPMLRVDTVTLEQPENFKPFTLTAGDTVAILPTFHPDEFPQAREIESAHSFKIDITTLRNLFSRVRCAQSIDETRYVLNGICCELKDNTFRAIATDGRRLCVAEAEIEIAEEAKRDFIIPTPAVQTLIRLLGKDGTVIIAVAEPGDKAAFTIGDHAVVTTKLIDGQYPKWRDVLPPAATRRHTFPSLAVISALQRVATGNHEKINAAKLTFHPDHIIITNGGSEPPVRIVEKIKHTQPPDAGPMPFECQYNPAFLADGIQSCRSEIVNMGLGEKIEQPAMLTGESSGFFYILMPMRSAE